MSAFCFSKQGVHFHLSLQISERHTLFFAAWVSFIHIYVAIEYGEAWAFFVFSKQGVHFHLSLQISGGGGETAEFTDSLRISVSLWTQKSCCREVGENLQIHWPFRNRNVAVEECGLFLKLCVVFCPSMLR